ncbi:MAG: hypothetical protein PV353_09960, partial [Bartonella sp.]|nr:hypothetical protein [Bartonella sp.]
RDFPLFQKSDSLRVLRRMNLCKKVVEMPWKSVQDILNISGNIDIEILSFDSSLYKALQDL